jgi:hypothetical protein
VASPDIPCRFCDGTEVLPRYEDIKHELDPRLRELHDELIERIAALAMAREPGLTREESERRVNANFERRRRERAEGSKWTHRTPAPASLTAQVIGQEP